MAQRLTRAVVVTVCVLALVGASAPATGGDQTVSLEFDPETTEAEPGERVELTILAETNGGADGEGIRNSTLRLIYPGEYLDVVAVEPGGFMQASQASLSVDRRVNNSVGVLEFDQNLPTADDGVLGEGEFAHVTLEVAEDAPPSTFAVDFDEPYFELAVSGFPLPSFTEQGEIAVAGGGERIEPDPPESVALDGDALPADEADSSAAADEADDSGPGLGVVTGLLAVVAVAVLVGVRSRSGS